MPTLQELLNNIGEGKISPSGNEIQHFPSYQPRETRTLSQIEEEAYQRSRDYVNQGDDWWDRALRTPVGAAKWAAGTVAGAENLAADWLYKMLDKMPQAPVSPYMNPGEDPRSVMTPQEKAYLGTEVFGNRDLGAAWNDLRQLGLGGMEKAIGFMTGTADQLINPEAHGTTSGEVAKHLVTELPAFLLSGFEGGKHKLEQLLRRIDGISTTDPEFYKIASIEEERLKGRGPVADMTEALTGQNYEDFVRNAVITTQRAPEDIYFATQMATHIPQQGIKAASWAKNKAKGALSAYEMALRNKTKTENASGNFDELWVRRDQERRLDTQGMDQYRQRQLEDAFGEEIPREDYYDPNPQNPVQLTPTENYRLQGRPDLLRRQLSAEQGISDPRGGFTEIGRQRGPAELSAAAFEDYYKSASRDIKSPIQAENLKSQLAFEERSGQKFTPEKQVQEFKDNVSPVEAGLNDLSRGLEEMAKKKVTKKKISVSDALKAGGLGLGAYAISQALDLDEEDIAVMAGLPLIAGLGEKGKPFYRKAERLLDKKLGKAKAVTGEQIRGQINAMVRKGEIKAEEAGISIRLTKTNKPVPNVRKSGVAVPVPFAEYKDFKDVKQGSFGGTKDITRIAQEADGSLSAAEKAKLPGQSGPVEHYVLHRTRDLEKLKFEWGAEQQELLTEIFRGLSKKQRRQLTQIQEKLSRRGAYVDPEKFVDNVSQITNDPLLVERAQELRKWYESVFKRQNEARKMRNQNEIPYRNYYAPHTIREATIWEKAFGLRQTPEAVMTNPQLPDYIKPDAAFNPRAMAREAGMPDYLREMDAAKLAENYANTAATDIFNTSIIQNNKAFAQQLESMGYPNTARAIQDWTAESYAGVNAAIDRSVDLPPSLRKGMRKWRTALNRAVFPINLSWNLFVQTSSANLTQARYGIKNSTMALKDWFLDKKFRDEVAKNAYSFIVKSHKSGRISHQDLGTGNVGQVKIFRTKLEKANDAANLLTEVIEQHLTGWSVAAAYRHGKSLGLEGKALWEYASDGGAKTQSMYNRTDLPGMLRSEFIKTGGPFQTFSFELFNSLRELGDKTGMSMGTFSQRAGFVIRLVGGALAINYATNAIVGREPWSWKSFIPFYSILAEPIYDAITGKYTTSGRGTPAPIGMGVQFGKAVNQYFTRGDSTKLRQFLIKYLPGMMKLPGGTQISRTVDGLIAVAEGGVYDSSAKMKFPVSETKEQIRAILAGPYATEGGQEYIKNIGKSKTIDRYEELKKKKESGERLNLRELREYKKLEKQHGPAAEKKKVETKIINLLSYGREDDAQELYDDNGGMGLLRFDVYKRRARLARRKRERTSGND